MFGGFATPGHHPSSELGNELSSSPQRVVDSSSPERGGADAASEVPFLFLARKRNSNLVLNL